MSNIENKSVASIKDDLRAEHKNHVDGKYYYEEMLATSDSIANKIKVNLQKVAGTLANFADEKQKDVYKKRWESLHDELQNATSNLKSRDSLGKHEQIINDLAHKIDNAENDIIKIIEQVTRTKSINNIAENISKKENNDHKDYFEMHQGGSISLNVGVNKPRIDEVFGELIMDNKLWKISYANCKNEKIKTTMKEAFGGIESGYISRGTDTQGHSTFVVQSTPDSPPSTQRALIREGVSLYPTEFLQDQAIKVEQNKTAQLKNSDTKVLEQQLNQFGKLANKLNDKKEIFVKIAEEKLHNIIVDAKEHGRELHSEPITKIHTPWNEALIEVHLINEIGEKDIDLFQENDFDSTIYDILDSNKGDLVSYITARIKQKWNEYGHLDKANEIAVGKQEQGKEKIILDESRKNQVKGGLGKLITMAQNMIDAEGDTIVGSRDEKLRALSSYLRDIHATINTGKEITEYDVTIFSDSIARLYKKAFNLSDVQTSKDGIEIQKYNTKKDINTVFLGTPEQVADVVRLLGERATLGSNTNTSFVADDIANNVEYFGGTDKNNDGIITNDEKETKSTMKIEKTIYDECFKRIETLLGTNNPGSIEKIDKMYELGSAKELFKWFIENGLLPKNTKFENPLMRDGGPKSRTETIFNQLKVTREQTDKSNLDAITANARKGRAEQKIQLEAKGTLTSNEMQQLQLLHVLENNPTKGEKAIQEILNAMRYQGVADLVRGQLTPWLVKEGGGATGPNAYTYNDIIGAGGIFDFSDANAVSAQGMVVAAVEEIGSLVIAAALIGASPFTGGTSLAGGIAVLATRLGKRGPKILSFVKSLVKNSVIAGLAQGILVGERSIKEGGIDHQIDAFALGFAQKLGMLSVLNVVTNSAKSGVLARLFKNAPDGKLKVAGQFTTQLLAEELGMAGTDFASSLTLSDEPFTLKQLTDNLLLGIAFEAVPGVKKVIIGDKINIDGNILTTTEAKAKLEELIKDPNIKKAVEAKMKQYEGVKKRIEQSHNNYKKYSSPDQAKLQNHTKRVEKQDKFELQILQAQELLISISKSNPELISDSMKVLRDAGDIIKLSPNDIKRVQRELGVTPDGIWGDVSLNKLSSYFDSKLSGNKHWINTNMEISEASKNIKEQIQRENKQGKYAGELSTAMVIVSKLPEEGLLNAIKKLKSPDGFWKDDVIAIQKELGLTGKDVDGIFGPKTLKKLKEYLNDYGKNKITASDLVLTKQILHEEAIQKGIGDQKSFFAEAKANKDKLTIDGVEYSVKQGKDRVEIATTSIGGGKKPLSDGEKNNLFERYKQQKIEQFVNNHPDVKNAKIIDESVVDQNQIEPKAKTEDSISEKLLTEITVEGVTIPEAVATYFKNNPIAESVAKKLTPEDIGIIEKYLTDTMYMGGAYDKNTQMILKTREQIVEGYIRDIVVKRVDTPVHAVEIKKEIVQIEEIVSNTPQTEQQATGLIYQLGEWLGKNTVGPTLDTIKNIIKWLTDIAIKFPSLKDTITIISKKVESIRIKRSVENINALSGKSTQEKIDFVEKFDMNKASNQELIALYKMTGGQGDPKDRAVVILPDGTNTLQVKLKLDIAENMSTMRSEIKKQNQRVEHNFTNSPELKLSNQEVVLDIKIGEQFNLSLGRTEYQLFKNPQGVINFVIPGNPPRNIPLAAGKEYTIGRDHTELTGKIEDRTMSRNQVSIKVDEKGNVAVKDLKSRNKTVLKKEIGKEKIGKEEIINHNIRIQEALKVQLFELTRFLQEKTDIDYINKSIEGRKYFGDFFEKNNQFNVNNIKNMLQEMHKISAYKGSNIEGIGIIREKDVDGGTRPRAKEYVDQILGLLNMKSSQKNSKSGKTIYALVAEFDRIFTDTAQSLNLIKIELNKPKPNQIDILNHISDYYYNMIYARPMGNVNNSMFMNQINYLLKRSGLPSISHGQIDHIATRVDKNQFREIFKYNIKDDGLPMSLKGLEIDKASEEIIKLHEGKWEKIQSGIKVN